VEAFLYKPSFSLSRSVSLSVGLYISLAPSRSLALSLSRAVSLPLSFSLSRSLSQPNKALAHSLYVWQSTIYKTHSNNNDKQNTKLQFPPSTKLPGSWGSSRARRYHAICTYRPRRSGAVGSHTTVSIRVYSRTARRCNSFLCTRMNVHQEEVHKKESPTCTLLRSARLASRQGGAIAACTLTGLSLESLVPRKFREGASSTLKSPKPRK
jgi:hypothetical protein